MKIKKISIKKKLIILIFIISSIYTFYQKIERILNPYDGLEVHFIDVGQGDSTLLITPKQKTVLIDAGDEEHAPKVVGYIKSQGIDKLDYVIATHPDSDHIGGMDKVISSFDIEVFSMPLATKDTKQYKEIEYELKNKNISNTAIYAGDVVNIDESIDFEILSPQNGKSYSDSNEYSIVARVSYENTRFLLMADASMENEIEIINGSYDISADVLKLGHHGSSTSTSEYFLQKVNPSIAVVSAGKDNKYGHPHKEVMNLMKKYNINVFRTDKDGDIVMRSNGNIISMNN